MIVYTEIQKRLTDPAFRFPQGGAAIQTVSKFLDLFAKEFGSITAERLVDFCVCTAYTYRNRPLHTIQQIFGPASLRTMKQNSHSVKYYEDKWLASVHLNRENLVSMIADRHEHPQAKYIYVEAEETTKKRMLNQKVGYMLCQASTLGWSPISETCKQCEFVSNCQKETQTKYPELYRIRIEYGSKTNR